MLNEAKAQQIFEKVKKFATADEVEVLLAGGKSALTRFANNTIHQNVAEENYICSIRTNFGGRTARSTTNKFDDDSLRRAVGIIRAARRIEVYGIGSSAPIAQDLGYRLLQLGRDTKVVTDSHIQAVSAAMTDAKTAVITVSHSGSTIETVLATKLAREAGAHTIGIARLGKSPLERH